MHPTEVIRTKRDGGTLSRESLEYFILGHCRGDVSDPQMAAFQMAVLLRGMTFQETVDLTDVMTESGSVIVFADIHAPVVDKHSTGGVGDKVSLILAPMVAACGAYVPMLSGRGLGHTGGTLDKLESIPGFRTGLSLEEFRGVTKEVGFAMASQSEELVPADSRMYALRDATATIESPPLIAGSILSKKLAEGIGALVLDVTVGDGAFMRTEREAEELASLLVRVGAALGLHVRAFLTMLDQPRGRAIGNWLEVREAVDCLKGVWIPDLMEVTLTLGGSLLQLSGLAQGLAEGRDRCRQAITSGRAYETFLRGVKRQGGDIACLEAPETYGNAKFREDVRAPRGGWVTGMSTRAIGELATDLGAGRRRDGDVIDPRAGISAEVKIGDRVQPGDLLATVHASDGDAARAAVRQLQACIAIGDDPVGPVPRIAGVVDAEGRLPSGALS
jgi:pyrimidine-nucleoside phosphorylase